MNEKNDYLNEVSSYLSLAPKTCDDLLYDLSERIEDEEKEGVTINEILKKMGSPKKLAEELNEAYFSAKEVNYFEFKSNKNSNFPLIHIVLKNKFRGTDHNLSKIPTAKGVFAFGKHAQGIVAIGLFSQGIISLGLISLGVICGGPLAIGILAGGILSFGGISIGTIAIGILSIGNFILGYATFGNIAIGKFALGNIVSGNIAVPMGNHPSYEELIYFLRIIIAKSEGSPLSHSFYQTLLIVMEHPLSAFTLLVALLIIFIGIFYIYIKNYKKVYEK